MGKKNYLRRAKWGLFLIILIALFLMFYANKGSNMLGLLAGKAWNSSDSSSKNIQKEKKPPIKKKKEIQVPFFYQNKKFYLGEHVCSISPTQIDEKLLEKAIKKVREDNSAHKIIVMSRKGKAPLVAKEEALEILKENGFIVNVEK